jgi:DNA-binding CsgD family transcriptional regulator/tetratricopeptide (TPR) repeat protein
MALVGREAELALLDDLRAEATRGHRRVAVVRGEAGIGKTRLGREALARCERAGFETVRGAADELEQRRPFGLFADALAIDRARDRERVEIHELLHGGGSGIGGVLTESALIEFRIVELALEYVQRLGSRRPVALLLEDLHWADPSSLWALHRVAHAAHGLRLLLICTLRPYPERRELRALLAALDRLDAARLELGPLDLDAVQVLSEEISGAPPGRGLMRRLEAGGGNPLFVTELLEGLAAEGSLEISPEGSIEAPAAALPDSLRLTILRRVSVLPDRSLEALRTGSVLGSRFAVSELALALGLSVSALADSLRPALAAGVLVDAGERLAFRHELIRDTVYEDVPQAVRRALHRELAARLSESGAPLERIAMHMLRGADPGDTEAVALLRRAGRETAPRAPAIAAELLEGALALTPADASANREVRAELVEPLVWSGRGAEAVRLCRAALAEGDGVEREDHFRLGLARGLLTEGRLLEARGEFERLAHSPSLGQQLRPLVTAYAANLGAFLGSEEAAASAEAVLAAAPEGQAAGIARIALAASALFSGRADLAHERLDRLTEAGAGEWLQVRLLRGLTLLDLDRLDEAREALAEGLEAAAAAGVAAAVAMYRVTLVSVEYHAGRLAQAVAEHEAAVELARETGQRWLVNSHALRAGIAVERGELEEAERTLAAAEAESAELGPQLGVALVPLARARLAEAHAEPVAAAAAAAQSWQLARRYGLRSQLAWFGPHLVRILLAGAERHQAEAVSAAAESVAELLPVASRQGCALHCRGLLDDDQERLLEAVAVLRTSSHPLKLALALESAACERAQRCRDAGARLLAGEALELYDRSGAAGDSDRARARLRHVGIRVGARGPRGRPSAGWESLTEAELRVVRLVAEGQSNPQIAERLYLSRRTVGAHVSSALRKLGLSSRVELAAEAVRRAR